ncbi:hypothetical protein, partial [Micrococcus sp. F3Y]|uniref:hypothetical protein n=1 Tax=Micrococcus sp. F3Y TaxID=3402627 RepID=UPI003AF9112A
PPDGNDINPYRELEVGGEYQWRRKGAPHLFNPETVFRLQHSTRERRYDVFKDYTRRVDDRRPLARAQAHEPAQGHELLRLVV